MSRKFIIIIIVIGLIIVSIISTLMLLKISRNMLTTEHECVSRNNVFIVVYKIAKPLDNTFEYLSQLISRTLTLNSSGRFNVEFPLCYAELENLPPDLKSIIKQRFDFYPIFILRSQNMSHADIPIVSIIFDRYGDDFYIPKTNLTKDLYLYLSYYGFQYLNINGVHATIITMRKPNVNISITPILGSLNAKYYVYVYEDAYCPYCAKIHYEVFPRMLNLIDNGTIAILMKNFVVHEEAMDIQQYLVALYIDIRDSNVILDVIKFIYGLLLNESKPSLDKVKEYVLIKYGKEIDVERYADLAKEIIDKESEEAVQYLIVGTPGIIIWDNRNNIGIVITGFKSAEELIELLNFLNTL